jgi:LmbE family N-acetylglucosaminyl deacetylase
VHADRRDWQGLRLLFVHAHPDDEASGTAVTAAVAAQRGAETGLVCLTTGDRGAVVDPVLWTRVASGQPSPEAELRRLRAEELRRSARILGFRHVVQFDYGDSGMRSSHDNARPDCLWQRWRSGHPEPLARLVRVVRRLRPHVVVSYDREGGYGHPDHVAAHHLTVEAIGAAADPAFSPAGGDRAASGADRAHQVSKLYHPGVAASVAHRVLEEAARAGVDLDAIPSAGPYFSSTVADAAVTTVVDGEDLVWVKRAALRAHRSQFTPDFPFLWDLGRHPWLKAAAGREHHRLATTWGLPPWATTADAETHMLSGLEDRVTRIDRRMLVAA